MRFARRKGTTFAIDVKPFIFKPVVTSLSKIENVATPTALMHTPLKRKVKQEQFSPSKPQLKSLTEVSNISVTYK